MSSLHKVIFFDLYQTLLYTDISEKNEKIDRAFEAVFESYLWTQGIEQVRTKEFQFHYKHEQDLFYLLHDKTLEHHNFKSLLLLVFKNNYGIEIHEVILEELIYDYRKTTRGDTGLYIGVIEMLETLSKDYKLIIASYTQGIYSRRELEEFGIAKYFSDFIFSSEIGYKKTSDIFWEKCIDVSGVRREGCLMVGDSLDTDVYMAESHGIKAIWIINQLTQNQNSHNLLPKYSLVVENISKLPEIIKGIY